MRLAIVLVAVLALAACSAWATTRVPTTTPNPVNVPATQTAVAANRGSAPPDATANTATTAGYRELLKVRGDQINEAIEALHAGCSGGVVADRTAALATFNAAVAEPERLIGTTTPPEPCRLLWAGYAGLLEHLSVYRARLGEALASGETARVAAADRERYAAWSAQRGNDPQDVQRDTCR